MKTIDIVMPQGGSRGGVEYVIEAWTKSFLSSEYDLRVFHVLPGREDYLKGYSKQWTMAVPKDKEIKLDLEYFTENYAWFVKNYGAPDICIASWIPLMTSACRIVRNTNGLDYKIVSWLHSEVEILKQLGWGGMEHLGYADYHFCLSGKAESDIIRAYPDAKTFVIGNPVKPVYIPDYSPDSHTMCYVGRIEKEKRLDVILKALALSKDKRWKLLVVGDGTLKKDMKDLSERLGISEQVTFMGWRDDPWPDLKEASIMIVSSDYEGFCITAHEASWIGMTLITTPVNGCTDYIIPGKNGYYFDNSDPQNLANILDFISLEKLPICDQKSCKDSVSPYMWDNYFENVDKTIQSLLQ